MTVANVTSSATQQSLRKYAEHKSQCRIKNQSIRIKRIVIENKNKPLTAQAADKNKCEIIHIEKPKAIDSKETNNSASQCFERRNSKSNITIGTTAQLKEPMIDNG